MAEAITSLIAAIPSCAFKVVHSKLRRVHEFSTGYVFEIE